MPARALTSLLLAVLTAALLAACGGDDGDGGDSASGQSPEALVAGAAKASRDADSYRMTTSLSSSIGDEEIALKGEVTSAADQSRSHFEGTFSQGGEGAQAMEFLSVGDDNFLRGELLDGALPDGKEWLRVEDQTASTMTPAEFLEFLEQAPEIEEAGREEIRGEETIHLSGPLDMKRLTEQTSSEAAKQFSQLPGAERLKATIDVWVDSDDQRMRRMRLEMRHPDADGAMTVHGDILEWDVSLDDVEAPPASEVADPSELGAGAAGA